MTIVDVRVHRFEARLHTPFVTALRSTEVIESTVVELVDADGRSGFGEAPQVWRVTGESLAGAAACISGPLADAVRGRSVDEVGDLAREVAAAVVGNHGAKAAVDVALHDLAARRLGIALPQYLGSSRREVRTDVTLSAAGRDELVAAARQRAAEGFDCLKLKVGAGGDDVAAVSRVREAVGPSVRIRLDANQGWSVREAIRTIRALEDADCGIELVEQPVVAADLAGLADVTIRVDTPVMADESVFGVRDLVEVIRLRAADLVNIKLAKCGGLTAASTMIRLAEEHGIGWIVGSMMEGPVGVGAAASLAAAFGPSLTCDLDAAWWLAEPSVQGGVTYAGHTVRLPDESGLGIEGLR
jgi:L-alanine-DL-glutamate epimerase-like enolase superfamily enzyme